MIDRLNAEARTVLALPEVRERLQALGADPSPTTTQELERIVAHEIWENRELARKADIRLE